MNTRKSRGLIILRLDRNETLNRRYNGRACAGSAVIPASASTIEKDKAEHFGAGMVVDYAEAALFPKWTPFERFLGVVAIAGAKEWYDRNHSDRHSAEWKDFAATCLGGLTGEGTIWIVHKTW